MAQRLVELVHEADDHLSTGNGTRFGVFGMLYGLHGSYWWPVLEARRAPVLLETLVAMINHDKLSPRQMRPVLDAVIDWVARTRFEVAQAPR